jgi:hypothetical protein
MRLVSEVAYDYKMFNWRTASDERLRPRPGPRDTLVVNRIRIIDTMLHCHLVSAAVRCSISC